MQYLLEGLFHTEEIYPCVLSDTISEQELLHKIECCDVSVVYMIGGDYEPLIGQQWLSFEEKVTSFTNSTS